MKNNRYLLRLLIWMGVMLTGSILNAQTHKIRKDGKVKNKSHKEADHHHRTENKKKHHNSDFRHHSMDENKSFHKKKKKKAE